MTCLSISFIVLVRENTKSMICVGVASLLSFCICLYDVIPGYNREFWAGYAEKVVYIESYTTTESSTDSKGRTTTRTVYHYPEYFVVDNNNVKVSIDENEYLRLGKLWNHQKLPKEGWLPGNGTKHEYPATLTNKVVVNSVHFYSNRSQSSNSVYKYTEVSKDDVKQYNLFERPQVNGFYHVPCVFGYTNDSKLSNLNAIFGKIYQVRLVLLVWRNADQETVVMQENYWKGGAKNEFVMCVSINNNGVVDWAKAFSWSESENLKADFKNTFIMFSIRLFKQLASLYLIGSVGINVFISSI
jgi:hypothetical protein